MIIIFGGSFNPPTIAHYQISAYLINKYNPTKFIFVPVGNSYEKPGLIDFSYRYEMLNIIAGMLENVEVSDYENKPSYEGTLVTLNYFQKLYPKNKIYYVIGADNLVMLEKWINYETLLSNYRFIVIARQNNIIKNNPLLNRYRSFFVLEDGFSPVCVSSKDYREKKNDDIVLNEINDFIYKNKLYDRGG